MQDFISSSFAHLTVKFFQQPHCLRIFNYIISKDYVFFFAQFYVKRMLPENSVDRRRMRATESCQQISQGMGFNFRNCKHREAPSNSTSFFCSSDKTDNPSASFENHLNFSQRFSQVPQPPPVFSE